MTDEQLVNAAKVETSKEYISALFMRYKPLIYGICLKYFRDGELANDETMHIYEKLLKTIKKHEVKNFKPWLYTLSRNHCLDKLRTASNKRIKIEEALRQNLD